MDASASFIGGSYKSQSPLADCEELINWYVEQLQSPAATAKRVLYPTPGVKAIATLPAGSGRAHIFTLGREFAVIGPSFVEIYRNGTTTTRGTVIIDQSPATLCSSGDLSREVFITSGGHGYIFNLDTNNFSEVTAIVNLATMGAYLDGYFIALDVDTSTVYCSALGDGTTWDTSTNWAQRSASPDRWMSMKVAGRFIYLLGERTSEIWYNAGTIPFPFAFYEGAPLIQYGCLAWFSPAVIGDELVWVGITPAGRRCVVKANIQAQAISTYPIDTALEGYRNVEWTIGDVYSDRGHTFYVVGFDDANVTWVWDIDTGEWHKRMEWDRATGQWKSWRPRYYANAFGEHRMLDSRGRSVLQVSDTFGLQADGDPIRRLRRTPAMTSGNDRIFYSSLELFFETGLKSIIPDLPFAEFVWTIGETTTLDASTSSTPIGTIASYSWYLNDVLLGTDSSPFWYPSTPDPGDVIKLVITATSGTASAMATIPTPPGPPPYSGVSTPLAGSAPGEREPQVMLGLSNDAGRTFVTRQWRGAGLLGQYQRRVRWNGLGSARRRVFEVICADEYPWRLVGADLRIDQDVPQGEKDRG